MDGVKMAYNFGLKVAEKRKALGMTQMNLADATDIAPNMISAYESGRHIPNIETAERILNGLGCRFEIVNL